MCLGLHRIIVNNGTKDNIVIDKVLVQGFEKGEATNGEKGDI